MMEPIAGPASVVGGAVGGAVVAGAAVVAGVVAAVVAGVVAGVELAVSASLPQAAGMTVAQTSAARTKVVRRADMKTPNQGEVSSVSASLAGYALRGR
jgi:predicted metalloprotease